MSSMLEQAIVDAKALKEAAIKSAESTIIEKYAQEIKDAVENMLEDEEPINEDEGSVTDNIPAAAMETDAVDNSNQDVVVVNFDELEARMESELEREEIDAEEMTDRHEFAEETEENAGNFDYPKDEQDSLKEEEELDLANLFEDEEIELSDEQVRELAEKLTLDFQPEKSGFLGTPVSQSDEAHEEYKALEAHESDDDEKEQMAKELGKLRESNKKLNKKLNSVKIQKNDFEKTILKLKNALNETSVQNAKLLYTNQVLISDSLNGRQKNKIVEAISNAKTVEEAKVIFETLQSTVSGKENKSPKTLSEAVSRKSTLLPRTKEVTPNSDPRLDRMKKLAGLN